MSDAHDSHESHGSEEKKEAKSGGWAETADNWYDRIATYVSEQISTFVAFLFILFTIGAAYGVFFAAKFPHLVVPAILAPAFIGLVAYYNRVFATIMFVLFLIAFIIL